MDRVLSAVATFATLVAKGIVIGGGLLVVVFLSWWGYETYRSFRASKMDVKPVIAWALTQGLSKGEERKITLPPEFGDLSCEGVAHVAHLTDGRHCILLKTSIGWKDNFEGVFSCDRVLAPEEFSHGYGGAPKLALSSYRLGAFAELYIRGAHGTHGLDVYMSLH